MARRGISAHEREQRAKRGALQAVARGERPLYRVRTDAAGAWTVDWAPWLRLEASSRADALAAARKAIAA